MCIRDSTEIEGNFTCFTSGTDFLAFLRVIVQLLLVLALCPVSYTHLDVYKRQVDGSRVRLRLLDDVEIGECVVARGTYLYATVNTIGIAPFSCASLMNLRRYQPKV